MLCNVMLCYVMLIPSQKQLDDAKRFLATIAEKKLEDIAGDEDREKIADAYLKFAELLRDQLK